MEGVKEAEAVTPAVSDAAELSRAIERLGAEVRALRELALRTPADTAERMARYHQDRIWRILQAETPVPLRAGPCLALHVLPHSAFEEAPAVVNLAAAEFLIFGRGGSPTFDAEGKLIWPENHRQATQHGYARMTASGCVEAVETLNDGLGAAQPEALSILHVQRLVVEGTRSYLSSLAKLGVGGELSITVTLLKAKGLFAVVQARDYAQLPIASDLVSLPSVRVAGPAIQDQDLAKALRPALDVLWRTAGVDRCYSFDADGNFR